MKNRATIWFPRANRLYVRQPDVTDSIDFHELRHRLKLVRDASRATLFENRDGVACPVCGEPFDEALATSEQSRRLAPERPLEVCLLREDDRLCIFTHARANRNS